MSSFSQKFMKHFKAIARSLVAIFLVALIFFSHTGNALARRGGGRIGGGSFRAPTRSIPSPSRGSGNYSGGYYRGGYYGGSSFFFLPFFFGGGGGGLFSMLILLAIAGAVLQAFRGNSGSETGITSDTSKVTLAKIQVGLLSSARELQTDLRRLALEANTGSAEGLASILRETTLSLLRHPEYWVYVSSGKETTQFALAEHKFNGMAMSERSKLTEEVISNVNSRLYQAPTASKSLAASGAIALEHPSEFVVVTLLAAVTGESLGNLAKVRSASELKQALNAIGSIPADRLLALEVLWEPQSEEFTLTSEEVLTVYPELVRI
jgi:uncharacterized membrane protein